MAIKHVHTPGAFSHLITPGCEANMQLCGGALRFVETTNMAAVFFICDSCVFFSCACCHDNIQSFLGKRASITAVDLIQPEESRFLEVGSFCECNPAEARF